MRIRNEYTIRVPGRIAVQRVPNRRGAPRGGALHPLVAIGSSAGALCAAIILCTAALLGAQASNADSPSFDELYRKGQQINAGIKTLTARFTETTTSALLEEPIVEHGQLFVERAKPRVALRYENTDRVLVIDGDRLTTVWSSRKIRQTQNIGSTLDRMRDLENGDGSALRRVFDVDLRDTSTRAGTRELRLMPKRREIRENLSQLELWVDPETALMQAMRLTFSNGDTKLMEFEDVVRNATIDEQVFSVPK